MITELHFGCMPMQNANISKSRVWTKQSPRHTIRHPEPCEHGEVGLSPRELPKLRLIRNGRIQFRDPRSVIMDVCV